MAQKIQAADAQFTILPYWDNSSIANNLNNKSRIYFVFSTVSLSKFSSVPTNIYRCESEEILQLDLSCVCFEFIAIYLQLQKRQVRYFVEKILLYKGQTLLKIFRNIL